MELAQPYWLLCLLLLPGWALLALKRGRQEATAGHTLWHPLLGQVAHPSAAPPGPRLPVLLTALAGGLMVLALAQPRQVGDWVQPPPAGRDILLVIDTSRTMSISDFHVDGRPVERLAVLKEALARFIQARQGDRFGILAFGSTAATLAPPTFDRDYAIAQLRRLQVGMAGPDTALGDALGLALKQLQPRRLRPALILVSDGAASNSGDLTPAEAVTVARQLGAAVHTVQFGSDLFAAGRVAVAHSDPQPDLAAIARLTGGRHYLVGGSDDMAAVIADIDASEKTLSPPARHRQVRQWYWLPLALAAACLAAARLIGRRAAA